jgi:hypothetical protein
MKSFLSVSLFVLCAAVAMGCKAAHKRDSAKSSKVGKQSEQAVAAAPGAVTCSMKAEKRVLEVKSANGGCEVMYTKGGETKSVATSKHSTDHCNKTVEKIKGNLAAAGWTCN